MRPNRTKLLLIALFLCLAPTALSSTTWYVDGVNGSDSNSCTSTVTACQTIGHAISLALSGDSVKLAAATYTENLLIDFSLRLTGSGAATTIIDGGGIRVVAILNSAAHVSFSKVTIRNGSGSGGGGILNWGVLTINNSTVSNNLVGSESSAAGGGIYNTGTVTINASTLSGNGGSGLYVYGGAIYNSNTGTLAINNSTLNGNIVIGSFGGAGGGIYNLGTAKISNVTLSGNSASLDGGNIYNGGTVILQNSIVANSPAGGNCAGTMTSHSYNLSSDSTCNFSNTGDMNNTDPRLGPLQNNGGPTQTMAVLAGSPAIDAGNPSGCTDNHGHLLKTDQRGQPRPDKTDTSGCDVGAYESQIY